MSKSLFDQTYEARDELYATFGEMDPDVISHVINPAFMGGPAWPAMRQAWRVIRNEGHTIIASDGLSDPFDNEEDTNAGFGIEILAETSDKVDDIASSWLFKMVYEVSQQAAAHGGLKQLVDDLEFLSMEIEGKTGLEHLENEHGRIGVYMGALHPQMPKEIDLPGGSATLITVKLLTLPELEYILQNGEKGRAELNRRFEEQGTYHVSSTERASVV
ncbi:MAG: hypothetical protein AAFX87_20095 [Bacteroidota bacterium]